MSPDICAHAVVGYHLPANNLYREVPSKYPPEYKYDPVTGNEIEREYEPICDIEDECSKVGLQCHQVGCGDSANYFIGVGIEVNSWRSSERYSAMLIPDQYQITVRYLQLLENIGIKFGTTQDVNIYALLDIS